MPGAPAPRTRPSCYRAVAPRQLRCGAGRATTGSRTSSSTSSATRPISPQDWPIPGSRAPTPSTGCTAARHDRASIPVDVYTSTGMFDVLAEPNRRRILDQLLDRPRTVGDLVAALSISQPSVSKHLRVLRDAGVVEARKDAQRRVYELRPEALAEVLAWVEPYRRLWAGRLDALERHLDAKERR